MVMSAPLGIESVSLAQSTSIERATVLSFSDLVMWLDSVDLEDIMWSSTSASILG